MINIVKNDLKMQQILSHIQKIFDKNLYSFKTNRYQNSPIGKNNEAKCFYSKKKKKKS